MSDAAVGPYQERDRKPGGKTRVKEIWKVLGLKEEEDVGLLDRSCRPSGRMIFNTITATPDDGGKPEEKKEKKKCVHCRPIHALSFVFACGSRSDYAYVGPIYYTIYYSQTCCLRTCNIVV